MPTNQQGPGLWVSCRCQRRNRAMSKEGRGPGLQCSKWTKRYPRIVGGGCGEGILLVRLSLRRFIGLGWGVGRKEPSRTASVVVPFIKWFQSPVVTVIIFKGSRGGHSRQFAPSTWYCILCSSRIIETSSPEGAVLARLAALPTPPSETRKGKDLSTDS